MSADDIPEQDAPDRPSDPPEAVVDPSKVGFTAYNVIATMSDTEAAREAIGALEARGIDSSHISLLGRRAEEASRETDVRPAEQQAEHDVGKRVLAGGAAGTAGGAAVGFLAGLAAFAIPGVGPVIGAGVWAATIGGGVAGGAVGGVVGGVSALPTSTPEWELTYEDVRQGRVLVGVHADDEDIVNTGAEVLEKHGALRADRFDADGRRA